jgi:hypothetical protein
MLASLPSQNRSCSQIDTGRPYKAFSHPCPQHPANLESFDFLHTLSKWFPFCFHDVSTNLAHIIENLAKNTHQKVGYPAFSLFPLTTKTKDELRAFNALLDFLLGGVPFKTLFKQAILVTALSAQYLAMHNPSHHSEKARSLWF